MITAEKIGASAMIAMLKRFWVPHGTPPENISAGLDGAKHRRHLDKYIAETKARNEEIYGKHGAIAPPDAYLKRLEKDRSSYLWFRVDRTDQTCFEYRERYRWWDLHSTEPFPAEDQEPGHKFYGTMGLLRIWDEDEGIYNPGRFPQPQRPYSSAKQAQFATKWLPTFRRNCWIFGCDVESSREERIAWLEGLTSDEIKEWKLKV